MHRNLALRVRLEPTPAQAVAFAQIAGCCRLVFNAGLEQRAVFWRQFRAREGKALSWYTQKAELPAMKEVAPFLKVVPSHCLQQALADLDAAYRNFFEGRAGYPRRRRRYEHDSFRFPDRRQIRLDSHRGLLHLPKFGRTRADNGAIRCVLHRRIKGSLRSVTIVRDGHHWYAALLYRVKLKREGQANDNLAAEDVIGIDCGVAVPFMTSDGEALGHAIEPLPRSGRAKRGKCLQQQLARCRRGSKRRQAAKARLAVFKAREKRHRKDMIEQVSCALARKARVVVLEDLRVRSMTASARGTVEAPGSNVAAKAGLNRAILDKGWGMFRIRLGQKLAAKGGHLLTVPANHTSQRCAACGHVAAASRLSQACFRCASCGHEANADHNAACTIRHLGLVRLGLADPGGPAAGTAVAARGALGMSRAAKRECSLGEAAQAAQPASSGCREAERGLLEAPSFMAG